MGIGASIVLIVAGAVLKFAVTSVAGVNVEFAGLALIILGDIALMLAVIRGTEPARRRRALVYSDPRYLS
jgi:hypothetical protein